jgi:tripartite-type tricarboxylate transporter receptor subunit TctC
MNPNSPLSWSRRRWVVGATVATALAGLAAPTHAQAAQWPQKPLRLVAAGPAGGSADVLARLIGEHLARDLGQPVVVEPKPGAGGILAVNELAQAPRDGHTVLLAVNSLVSEVPHIIKTRVDMASEITPLAELARGGLVLVAHPGLPVKNLAELVAHVKARPGRVNYASYSAGTLSHLLGLQLNRAAGIEMVHVGYKGSTPGLTDVMGGHVPLMFDGMPTSLPLLKAGRLKALAISLPQRSPLLPEVPTFGELGYPQLEALAWMGLWCRPEVPAAVQARLREATLKVLARADVQARLAAIGFEPGQPRPPEALRQGLQADHERVGALLKSIGFQPE